MNLDKISVVILAAGLGTRLSNFRGGKTNKILLEINGTPMIVKQIEQLTSWGFSTNNIVCVTNPEIHESIEEVVHEQFGSEVKYVIQPEPLGIAHAFSYSKDLISSEYVLLVWAITSLRKIHLQLQDLIQKLSQIYLLREFKILKTLES